MCDFSYILQTRQNLSRLSQIPVSQHCTTNVIPDWSVYCKSVTNSERVVVAGGGGGGLVPTFGCRVQICLKPWVRWLLTYLPIFGPEFKKWQNPKCRTSGGGPKKYGTSGVSFVKRISVDKWTSDFRYYLLQVLSTLNEWNLQFISKAIELIAIILEKFVTCLCGRNFWVLGFSLF